MCFQTFVPDYLRNDIFFLTHPRRLKLTFSLDFIISKDPVSLIMGVRINCATSHHHPPPSTTTHHDPPPSTTSHHQPKYIHHHPPLPTTSQNISTNTHHDPPTAKTFFIRNPFIRISSHCLTAT